MVKVSVYCRLDQQMQRLIETLDKHERALATPQVTVVPRGHSDLDPNTDEREEDSLRLPFPLFLIQRA